jgi:hypothetical protein
MNLSLEEYLDRLESQEQQQQESKEAELLRQQQQEELQRLRHIRDFEQDVLKAELISQQFDADAEKGPKVASGP